MKQFKHFPHKWTLGANVIIKIVRIFVKIFSLFFVGFFCLLVLFFFLLRPASPVIVEIANWRESA